MHYLTIWTFKPTTTDETIARFKETGGMPPEGVTMHARWHDIGGGRGFAIAESDDPVAMAKWCRQWTDLLSFEIVPVLNDEQLMQALS